MIMRFFISLFILFVSAGSSLYAQDRPVIRATVTKNKVLLGEPFQLIVESSIPGGSIVRPLIIDTIPHFEFLEPPVVDTIREARGIQIKGVYTLTSFDSGHWVIPSFSLSARIRTDTIPIDVVFSDFDPNQPYHDIKDIIPVDEAKERNNWWYYAAGGALLLILLIVFLTRKKKKPKAEQVIDKDAYGEAIDSLMKLKKNKPQALAYYSELASIFRVYVLKRRGILSLQKTTHDLVIKLQSLGPDKQRFDRLAQALRLSDFVKFAKYSPSMEDDEEAWDAIKNSIEELERTT